MGKQLLKKLALLFILGISVQSMYAIDWSKDTLKINIQPEPGTPGNGGFIGADVPNAPDGYLVDNGTLYADKGNGFTYGWSIDISASLRYRINAADVSETDFRRLTLGHLQKGDPAIWEIALPAGKYHVFLCGGDAINAVDFVNSFDVEGTIVEDATPLTRGYDEYDVDVEVADGNLTIKPAEGLGVNSKLCYMLISKEKTQSGIDAVKTASLDVFASSSDKTVKVASMGQAMSVAIYSPDGVLVCRKVCTSENPTIQLPASARGCYILKAVQGQQVYTQKFLME
jgi:hypothetical protein